MTNPVLKERFINTDFVPEEGQVMTAGGTVLKSCFLTLLMLATFAYTWYLQIAGFTDKVSMLYNIGLWGGLGLCLAICFLPKNKYLIITTPLYAMCEGLALGYISVLANGFYPGIVAQAALGTFFVLIGMLTLYSTKIIKVTEKFRTVMASSIFAIFGIYLFQIILGFFHISIPGLFSSGPVGIGFSLLVVGVASFSLAVDFEDITRFSQRINKNYEWYFAFSLMVTVIWLYIEMLNLLMKFQSRNN